MMVLIVAWVPWVLRELSANCEDFAHVQKVNYSFLHLLYHRPSVKKTIPSMVGNLPRFEAVIWNQQEW